MSFEELNKIKESGVIPVYTFKCKNKSLHTKLSMLSMCARAYNEGNRSVSLVNNTEKLCWYIIDTEKSITTKMAEYILLVGTLLGRHTNSRFSRICEEHLLELSDGRA